MLGNGKDFVLKAIEAAWTRTYEGSFIENTQFDLKTIPDFPVHHNSQLSQV